MESNNLAGTSRRHILDDVILAELFLVQAGIESAMSIGNGIGEIARKFDRDADSRDSTPPLAEIIQRTASEAVEPYTSRLKYFRLLQEKDS